MSQLWVKVWVDSLGDVKVSRLPDHLWRRFYECVMLAGIRDEGGLLPSMDDCCWILHTNQELLNADFEYLAERGLMAKTDDGWLVVNWLKRQETAEARRQRRYRERQKAATTTVTSNVTDNVTVARNISASASASTSLINNNLIKLYESEIGTITPRVADLLGAAQDNYPAEWFPLAFAEAVNHNARKWSYIEAILKNWKANGFQSKNGKGGGDKNKQRFIANAPTDYTGGEYAAYLAGSEEEEK